jgi:uracil-DNA glycosylase family 4
LTGDRSGDWLYRALHRFGFASQPQSIDRTDGLRLIDCYITAAIHCAPPDNKPLPEEFVNCRPYLVDELRRLKRAKVVVALGRIAFRAYLSARKDLGWEIPTPLPEFAHAREIELGAGARIICSYHPSQQNTQTGRLTEPMLDEVFRLARRRVDGSGT